MAGHGGVTAVGGSRNGCMIVLVVVHGGVRVGGERCSSMRWCLAATSVVLSGSYNVRGVTW